MSAETDIARVDDSRGVVGVDIELRGALVARAGARQGRVVVPHGSTLAEAIEAWADHYGSHLRFALLEGDRLRSEVLAFRITDGANERLVASQPLRNGDTVRCELRD